VTVPHDGNASGKVTLAVRPEKLELSAKAPTRKNDISIQGQIRDVAYYGDVSNVFVSAPGIGTRRQCSKRPRGRQPA
jgi:ABC-type Fe3+/spermidine/putrescine transport system ATPase subunit